MTQQLDVIILQYLLRALHLVQMKNFSAIKKNTNVWVEGSFNKQRKSTHDFGLWIKILQKLGTLLCDFLWIPLFWPFYEPLRLFPQLLKNFDSQYKVMCASSLFIEWTFYSYICIFFNGTENFHLHKWSAWSKYCKIMATNCWVNLSN